MPPRYEDDLRLVASLVLLTFVTGLVDAASVLGLGHIFTANMTGNVVFLGFSLGGAHDVSITASLVAVAGFLLGATAGGRLARSDALAALPVALSAEIALLVAAVLVSAFALRASPSLIPLLVLLSVPMGLRNAVVRRLAVPDMTTTVLTMTLTGIAADSSLAGGQGLRLARRWAAVAAMLLGGLAGAVLLRRGVAWTIGAAVLADVVALLGILSVRQGRSKSSESGPSPR